MPEELGPEVTKKLGGPVKAADVSHKALMWSCNAFAAIPMPHSSSLLLSLLTAAAC